MQEQIYYMDIDQQTNIVKGFYCEEIHGINIPNECIRITEELWQYVSNMGQSTINIKKNKSLEVGVLGIESKHIFAKVIFPQSPPKPTEIMLIKEELLLQAEMLVDNDFRLTNIELGL